MRRSSTPRGNINWGIPQNRNVYLEVWIWRGLLEITQWCRSWLHVNLLKCPNSTDTWALGKHRSLVCLWRKPSIGIFKSSPGDSNVQWGLRITDWDHTKGDANTSRSKDVLLHLLYNYCLETFGLWNHLSSLTYNVSKPEMDLNLSGL